MTRDKNAGRLYCSRAFRGGQVNVTSESNGYLKFENRIVVPGPLANTINTRGVSHNNGLADYTVHIYPRIDIVFQRLIAGKDYFLRQHAALRNTANAAPRFCRSPRGRELPEGNVDQNEAPPDFFCCEVRSIWKFPTCPRGQRVNALSR